MGFIKVANETMCRPIRALTQMRGYDVSQHVLASFGGAGGQHACAIARSLGMRTIFVHRYSGVLSAVGIGLAEVVAEEQVNTFSFQQRFRLVLVLTSDQIFMLPWDKMGRMGQLTSPGGLEASISGTEQHLQV